MYVTYLNSTDPYMSTQREVLEGQTGSHRAKRANFGRGVRGWSRKISKTYVGNSKIKWNFKKNKKLKVELNTVCQWLVVCLKFM